MGDFFGYLLGLGFVGLYLCAQFSVYLLDKRRIQGYMVENGFRLISCKWRIFGPGWFGERDSRIYAVIYEDTEGNICGTHIKTALGSGVYHLDSEIIQPSDTKVCESLQEENARLKEEIRRLKSKR